MHLYILVEYNIYFLFLERKQLSLADLDYRQYTIGNSEADIISTEGHAIDAGVVLMVAWARIKRQGLLQGCQVDRGEKMRQ